MSPPIVNEKWLNDHAIPVPDAEWLFKHQSPKLIIYSHKCRDPLIHSQRDCVSEGHVYYLDIIMTTSHISQLRGKTAALWSFKKFKISMPMDEVQFQIFNHYDPNAVLLPVYYGHVRASTAANKMPSEVIPSFGLIQPFIIEGRPKEYKKCPEGEKALWYMAPENIRWLDYDIKASNIMFINDKGDIRNVDIECIFTFNSINQRNADGTINMKYDGEEDVLGGITKYSVLFISSEIHAWLMLPIVWPEILDMTDNQRLPLAKAIGAANVLTPTSLHITEDEIARLLMADSQLSDEMGVAMGFKRGGEFTGSALNMFSFVMSVFPSILTDLLPLKMILSTFYRGKNAQDVSTQLDIHAPLMYGILDAISRLGADFNMLAMIRMLLYLP